MLVRQDLDLNVPRLLHVLLDEHPAIPKGSLGFAAGRCKRVFQLLFCTNCVQTRRAPRTPRKPPPFSLESAQDSWQSSAKTDVQWLQALTLADHPHAPAAAAHGSLEDDREAGRLGKGVCICGGVCGLLTAGHNRHPALLCQLPGRRLVPQRLHRHQGRYARGQAIPHAHKRREATAALTWIVSGLGPTKTMPSSAQRLANCAFSDRKPYLQASPAAVSLSVILAARSEPRPRIRSAVTQGGWRPHSAPWPPQ